MPFHDPSASYHADAASMAPPGTQHSQPVQMSMPHELDTSGYYGWHMPYQLPPQQPVVSAALSLQNNDHRERTILRLAHSMRVLLRRRVKGTGQRAALHRYRLMRTTRVDC